MTVRRGLVMHPYYLVVDVSRSMADERRGRAVDGIVPELLNALEDRDDVDEPVMLCVVEFSGEVRMLARLDRLATVSHVPPVSSDGDTTSFGTLFRFLRDQIASDVRALLAENVTVSRPVVILVTDGEATDQWEPSFVRLTEYDRAGGDGFPWYPYVVPVGPSVTDRRELAGLAYPPGIAPVVVLPAGQESGGLSAVLRSVPGGVLAAWGEPAAAPPMFPKAAPMLPDLDDFA